MRAPSYTQTEKACFERLCRCDCSLQPPVFAWLTDGSPLNVVVLNEARPLRVTNLQTFARTAVHSLTLLLRAIHD